MNKNRGSNLEDFLKEEGIFEECNAEAVKRVIAFQLESELKKQKMSKSQFAKRMNTSRSAVDRLLDPKRTWRGWFNGRSKVFWGHFTCDRRKDL